MAYVADSAQLAPQGKYVTGRWIELVRGSDVRDFDAQAIVEDMIGLLAGEEQ